VDFDVHPFKIAKSENLDRLKESLATVGLLSLPRVQSLKGGWWQVVTGWKRLKAAARLGWGKIPAVVLGRETSEAHLLLLYLHDNAFTRAFNPLEQALLASRLLAHWDREALVTKCLPLLGLPPALAHLDRLLAVARLETPWQELVAQEHLALTAAARLAVWDPAERLVALPFLTSLPLSQSKQEEFVAGVEILARREGVPPSGILLRRELQQSLADMALSPQERAAAVRRRLNDWVSPRFSAAQKAFAAGLDRLGLKHHPRMHLSAPPAFEGPDFRLEIKFQDAAELMALLVELQSLVKEPDFQNLTAF
jgi:ParB-like chromosome segregation protein Spo0J